MAECEETEFFSSKGGLTGLDATFRGKLKLPVKRFEFCQILCVEK